MKFAGGVVKHLGLNMYAGPVPAIAELIANAWDANAGEVHITVPFDQKFGSDSVIEVSDYGHGMSFRDCDDKYLVIGRDARKEDGNYVNGSKTRKRMARKGLGKLAGFGIANKIEVITVRKGLRTSFVMDYSAIEKLNHGENYEIVPTESGVATKEKDGTRIVLRDLKLRHAIPEDRFMTSMARRFSVLSDTFKVNVNGKLLRKEQGPFQIHFPTDHVFDNEEVVDGKLVAKIPGAGKVTYWIGFTEKPIKDDESRGVTVLARGKLVQNPWFFEFSGGTYGQHGMQYMTGEVEADFIDEEDEDLVTTDRGSVQWSQEVPSLLRQWGQAKIADVLRIWAEKRAEIKIRKIQRETPFMDRIEKFPLRERTELKKVVTKMASIETIEDDRLVELVKSLINAYENKYLMHMVEEVSSLSPDAQVKLYDILKEFKVLEAVTLAQIVHSHIAVIKKFEEMVDSGVREKPDMQNLLKDNPWLIDPKWFALSHEERLETVLKKKFSVATRSKGKTRRLDFFCLGELGRAFVIEVKRPGEKIGKGELQQIEDYVDFLRREQRKVNDMSKQKTIFGYLVGTDFDEESTGKRERLQKDGIYTETWESLLDSARRSHKEFYDALKKRAPEDDPRMEDLKD